MNNWGDGRVQPPGGWVVGPTVAGIGTRLGAWVIDWALLALIGIGIALAGVVAGSVGLNPEAVRQLDADPAAQPSVPLLSIRFGEVVALAAAWVGVVVVYPAVAWSSLRGLPGQRLASLEVADAVTGANLSPARALLRAAALNGVPAAAFATSLVASLDLTATLPASSYGGNQEVLLSLAATSHWRVPLALASLTLWLWLPALLVSAVATFRRRGLHDLAGRSVVVSTVRARTPWPNADGVMPGYDSRTPGQASDGLSVAPPGGALSPPPAGPPPQAPPTAGPAGRPSWIASGEPDPVAGKLGGVLRAAPLGRRVAAYVLDGLLVFGAYSLVFDLVRGPAARGSDPILERDLMMVILGAGAAQCAYFVATWTLIRGSLGQRATGLLVVRETGERLGFMDAMARWAVLQGPLALLVAAPIPYGIGPMVVAVWAALLLSSVRADAQRRGYHDRIAGSRVILQG